MKIQTPKIVFILLLFAFNVCFSQKEKLGKVTIEELKEKNHPLEASAEAAILFSLGESRIDYNQINGFIVTKNVKMKIKIYKKEGFDWANKNINYYTFSNAAEKIIISDAVTYNLVDGKVEKTKLKNEGEFDEVINKYWSRKKITMPNVKEGSIVEYEFTITSKNYGELLEWNFQTSIPVNKSEYRTYIPEYFIYGASHKGYVFPSSKEEKVPRSIMITEKETTDPMKLIKTTSFSTSKTDFLEVRNTYILENIPSMKNESYVNNISNYQSSVNHELTMIKFPNSPIKTFSTDWESVAKTIYESDDFGTELNKTGYFEDDIKELIKNSNQNIEKAALIFNYVKSRMNWNELNGYYCQEGVRQAYKNKTGNVAEINLMLTAMLRFAGIEANPVLLSTRSNGISFFPNLNGFNYVITAVELGNDMLLLDATSKNSFPNILPIRDLNWNGRLIRKDKSSSNVNLMPHFNSKDIITLMANIENDGKINGKIRRQLSEYEAFSFRENYSKVNKENYIEKLENELSGIDVSEYEIDNLNDLSKPIIQVFSFEDKNNIEIIGEKMYLSPMLFYSMIENPFKQEKREYPIDFSFPYTDKYTFVFKLPEGYTVESLPEAMSIETEDNIGKFHFNISPSTNKIQIVVNFDINVPVVNSKYYEVIKAFYQKMIEKQNEKIVLVKN